MEIKKKFDKNIISTLLLILFLAVCFFISSLQVNRIAVNACFATLDDTTAEIASAISTQVNNDRGQLEAIAGILSTYETLDSEDVSDLVCSFTQRGMISTLGLLLPDNDMILCSGDSLHMGDTFDFNTEADLAPYISGIIEPFFESDSKLIYQAVPILKNGNAIGVLYGFIELDTFAGYYPITAFNGFADLIVLERKTGNFLVDTWHDTLGNINDEALSNRKVKKGFSFSQMREDIQNGETGYIAFFSNTTNEYLYTCYKTIGVSDWMVQVLVPESIAFARAANIRRVLYGLAFIEILAFAFYFLWVLTRVHRDSHHKEIQLAQTLYMYDIQQTLFDAHKNPDLIIAALEKVAKTLTADRTFLLPLEDKIVKDVYCWPNTKDSWNNFLQGNSLSVSIPDICGHMVSGESILFYPETRPRIIGKKDAETLAAHSVSSMMLVPVLDSDEHLVGALGALNIKKKWNDTALLECVARNFLMALSNISSYHIIEQMGIIDALTGLKNRNCYQHSLLEYSKTNSSSLHCIYMDVNGLHELNNHLGHVAGDEMLSFIGNTLQSVFGRDDTYRIGGDEFVAFCRNLTDNEVHRRIQCFHDTLLTHNYHVSIGLACQDTAPHIDNLVSDAERKMYEAKHQYYQEKGDVSKTRELNLKLEEILLEKKDAETFLSIISSYFMGTYIVSLVDDHTRAVYKPSYFSEILEKYDYQFSIALKVYIERFVTPEYQPAFIDFLNYTEIDRMLTTGQNPEYHYQKTDGTHIILRVYPADDYSRTRRETFWLFERTSNTI